MKRLWMLLIMVLLAGCEKTARPVSRQVIAGSDVTIYEPPPYPMEFVRKLALVEFAGNDAAFGANIRDGLLQRLRQNPELGITRHQSLEQAIQAPGVDAVLDGSFVLEREVVGAGSALRSCVTVSAWLRMVRIDRSATPPKPFLMFELPCTFTRVLDEAQADSSEAEAALVGEVVDGLWSQVARRPVEARRVCAAGDKSIVADMRNSRWAEAYGALQDRIFSHQILSPLDYYALALCFESVGEFGRREKARDYYLVALHQDPSLVEAAEGLARLEWGGLYPGLARDGLMAVQSPRPGLPYGAGVAVIGAAGSSQWSEVTVASGESTARPLNPGGAFAISDLARRAAERELSRTSPWLHRPAQTSRPVMSLKDLFDLTGGKLFESGETDYLLFIRAQEQGAQIQSEAEVVRRDGVRVVITVLRTQPRLQLAGEVTGEAFSEWSSSRADGEPRGPTASRIHLVNEAVSRAMNKLRPTVEYQDWPVPDCEPVAKTLLRAGAYREAESFLVTQLLQDDRAKFMTSQRRAANLLALGLSYEARGQRYFNDAASAYVAAQTLDPDNSACVQSLARVRAGEERR